MRSELAGYAGNVVRIMAKEPIVLRNRLNYGCTREELTPRRRSGGLIKSASDENSELVL
ncbi:hypothetical protein [Corynebacterium deserti]|uniref:hypothetical protein n=1 Tax=Corynebacterium deserti TaxID=1408191 RepID=UPI0012E10F69|nr:hypothetical protein [Corynebacterium deserti]